MSGKFAVDINNILYITDMTIQSVAISDNTKHSTIEFSFFS